MTITTVCPATKWRQKQNGRVASDDFSELLLRFLSMYKENVQTNQNHDKSWTVSCVDGTLSDSIMLGLWVVQF